MSRRKGRKGPRSGAVMMLLAMGAFGLGALAVYVQRTPADKVPVALRRVEEPKSPEPTLDRRGSRDSIIDNSSRSGETVMVPTLVGERIRMIPGERGRTADAKVYVVNKTLEAFRLEGAHANRITVVGGVARIDFNDRVQQGMGSTEGSLFLKALRMAMGQFKDVEMLRFTVDGKEVETLDGHTEIMDGVSVIRPGSTNDERP